eukprot:jgi/Psemu1/12893/gm1.12893_g
MSIFVVCSAVAAAGLVFALESGKVFERRASGLSKEYIATATLPFQDYDWTGQNAKRAAGVFVALVAIELFLFPRSWNPFTYIFDTSTDDGSHHYLRAFTVFGSWSGILAVGFGSIFTLNDALVHERQLLEAAKLEHEKTRLAVEKFLEEEELRVSKEMRVAVASAAAIAGERRQMRCSKEHHKPEAMTVSENERVWSKTFCQHFDKKTMNIVDNAMDKRWRDVEHRGVNIEEMRRRNVEKEKKIKEQRARRVERVNAQQSELKDEEEKLKSLTDELEHLKASMERLKEENMAKEQERIKELKDREQALREREENFDQIHQQKLDKLTEKENDLRIREDRFESGADKQELERKSQKLENSMINVAKFKKEIEINEKVKLEDISRQEHDLLKRKKEVMEMAQRRELELSKREEELKEISNRREMELMKREKELKYVAERKEIELMKRKEELKKIAIAMRKKRKKRKAAKTTTTQAQHRYESEEEKGLNHTTEGPSQCLEDNDSSQVNNLSAIVNNSLDLENEKVGEQNGQLSLHSREYELDCPSEEQEELATHTIFNGEEGKGLKHPHVNSSFKPASLFDFDEEDEESISSIDKDTTMNSPLVCIEGEGPTNGFIEIDEKKERTGRQEQEPTAITDKCGNENSLFDNDDDEQEKRSQSLLDNDNESYDDEEEVDDESTCILNDNNEYKTIAIKQCVDQESKSLDQVIRGGDAKPDQLHVIEERESLQTENKCVEEDTEGTGRNIGIDEGLNSESTDDSLSCQIQKDITQKNHEQEMALDRVDPHVEETRDKSILSITSPLQEIRDAMKGTTNQNFSCGNMNTMAFDTAPYKNEYVISPASATSTSSCVSLKNDFPVSPTKTKYNINNLFQETPHLILNGVEERKEIEKENDGLTRSMGQNENNNNTSLVVSEEAAVEVIAWNDKGLV